MFSITAVGLSFEGSCGPAQLNTVVYRYRCSSHLCAEDKTTLLHRTILVKVKVLSCLSWISCLLMPGKLNPKAVPWQPGSLRPGNLPARDHKALLLDQHDPRPGPLDQQLQHLSQQNQEEVAPLQHPQLHQLLRAGGERPGPNLPQVWQFLPVIL